MEAVHARGDFGGASLHLRHRCAPPSAPSQSTGLHKSGAPRAGPVTRSGPWRWAAPPRRPAGTASESRRTRGEPEVGCGRHALWHATVTFTTLTSLLTCARRPARVRAVSPRPYASPRLPGGHDEATGRRGSAPADRRRPPPRATTATSRNDGRPEAGRRRCNSEGAPPGGDWASAACPVVGRGLGRP